MQFNRSQNRRESYKDCIRKCHRNKTGKNNDQDCINKCKKLKEKDPNNKTKEKTSDRKDSEENLRPTNSARDDACCGEKKLYELSNKLKSLLQKHREYKKKKNGKSFEKPDRCCRSCLESDDDYEMFIEHYCPVHPPFSDPPCSPHFHPQCRPNFCPLSPLPSYSPPPCFPQLYPQPPCPLPPCPQPTGPPFCPSFIPPLFPHRFSLPFPHCYPSSSPSIFLPPSYTPACQHCYCSDRSHVDAHNIAKHNCLETDTVGRISFKKEGNDEGSKKKKYPFKCAKPCNHIIYKKRSKKKK